MTAPPWNLTFADTAKEIMDDDSGRSQVATIDRGTVSAERLHPTAAYSRAQLTPGTRPARYG